MNANESATESQSIPREGTETTALTAEIIFIIVAIHTPRGDGNNIVHCISSSFNIVAIHTPRGDGNHRGRDSIRRCFRRNPYPARGRKQQQVFKYLSFSMSQSIPREGTETCLLFQLRCPCCSRNPYPARGRKLL